MKLNNINEDRIRSDASEQPVVDEQFLKEKIIEFAGGNRDAVKAKHITITLGKYGRSDLFDYFFELFKKPVKHFEHPHISPEESARQTEERGLW